MLDLIGGLILRPQMWWAALYQQLNDVTLPFKAALLPEPKVLSLELTRWRTKLQL